MWQGCTKGSAGNSCSTGTASPDTWESALSYCEGLDWAGHTDWRLPNRKELRSIVDNRRSNPTVDPAIFPATPGNNFWTSTTELFNSNGMKSYYVYFYDGMVHQLVKSTDNYIRCVRTMP
jgi:hypothetical protein